MVSSSVSVQHVENESRTFAFPWLNYHDWPKPSARGRFFVLGFTGLSLPFDAALAYQVTYGHQVAVPLWVFAVSTALGFTLLWIAAHKLLRPLEQTVLTLREELETLTIPVGNHRGSDELAEFPDTVAITLSALRQRDQELRKVDDLDPLTRVLTRQATHRAFHASLRVAVEDQKEVYLALLDCHRLSDINTEFGHESGDEALRQVGVRLKKHLRKSDWAARWGGDEFLVVLLCTPWEIEDALKRLARPVPLTAGMPPLRMTVGYTPVERTETLFQAVQRAEKALRRSHVAAAIPLSVQQ